MNDFDDLDDLERELGPSLRVALHRRAAEITDDDAPVLPVVELDALADESTDVIRIDVQRTRGERTAGRRWLIVAAAATAVALIVGGVLQRTEGDDVRTVPPAGPGPSPTTVPPPSPAPLPDGLKGLPPAGATPSTPETGQLLATLPIPIWVYEDGRVISARWTTHNDWTGFLEQRLTPEGVELVRAEILALEPLENCRYGIGNYGYVDGSRTVCESPGGTSLYHDDPQYLRLSELQYGAPSWLPASAWADPEPKPYVPSAYQVQINTVDNATGGEVPIDTAAMLAALPPEAAQLLTVPTQCPVGPGISPNTMLCFKGRTEEARQFGTAVGITGPSVNNQGDSGIPKGVFGSYSISFLPYLPHEEPVRCCGG